MIYHKAIDSITLGEFQWVQSFVHFIGCLLQSNETHTTGCHLLTGWM